jgi:hypothetical protein
LDLSNAIMGTLFHHTGKEWEPDEDASLVGYVIPSRPVVHQAEVVHIRILTGVGVIRGGRTPAETRLMPGFKRNLDIIFPLTSGVRWVNLDRAVHEFGRRPGRTCHLGWGFPSHTPSLRKKIESRYAIALVKLLAPTSTPSYNLFRDRIQG